MKSKAILMTLAMMSAALAGCTGSDGVTEIDDETLQQLFDDNIQDFMNNTSVTVNQEIHYHNNTTMIIDDGDYSTTVVNEYNNTTNVEGSDVHNYNTDNSNTNFSVGGGAVGNGSSGTLYLLDIQFSLADLMPDWAETDHRNNSIAYTWSYYDYLTNSERTDTFTIQCSDYYLVGSQSSNVNNSYSYWESSNYYYSAWENEYNSTIADMLQNAANAYFTDNHTGDSGYHVREACDEGFNPPGGFDDLHLFDIPLPEGVAICGIYDNNFQGLEEYVWGHTQYYRNSSTDNMWTGYGPELWRENYYPTDYSYPYQAFRVQHSFETIQWSYTSGGWVGGDQESVLSVRVNEIYPGHEYRLIAYYIMSPVLPLE